MLPDLDPKSSEQQFRSELSSVVQFSGRIKGEWNLQAGAIMMDAAASCDLSASLPSGPRLR